MFISLLSAALLGASSPSAVMMSNTDKPSDENKLVCKREKQIGSMVRRKKTCRTKGEWTQLAKESREELERGQRAISYPGQGQ